MKRFDVVGVGYSAVDYFGIVDKYPPPADIKMPMNQFTRQGGGPVATALVALSRLGASVAFAGKMGDDEFGRFMMEELKKENVDIDQVVIEPGPLSQFAFIIVDQSTGSRTILWSQSDVSPLQPSEMDRDFITSARILHLDGLQMEAGIQAAHWAKEAGMTVVLDGDTIRPGIEELISLTDVLIASCNFAIQFTGKDSAEAAIHEMNALGPKIVGVTLGEKGCLIYDQEKIIQLPAFHVDVVDTTGAGDVFHGAFIYGLLEEWPLDKMAEFANAVAAMKCRKLGGRAGIPSLDEVMSFIKSHQ